jgi:hypothetical protein
VAQRDGDIDLDADPDELALLIWRCYGAEALRKGGMPPRVTAVADQAMRCYRARKRPKPRYRANPLCAEHVNC